MSGHTPYDIQICPHTLQTATTRHVHLHGAGWSTLMWAVLEGEQEVVDCLLESNANVFIASTKMWDIPGHDWGFPRFSNALDILQIAMARSTYNEFHVPILVKLQPLFKVAE